MIARRLSPPEMIPDKCIVDLGRWRVSNIGALPRDVHSGDNIGNLIFTDGTAAALFSSAHYD